MTQPQVERTAAAAPPQGGGARWGRGRGSGRAGRRRAGAAGPSTGARGWRPPAWAARSSGSCSHPGSLAVRASVGVGWLASFRLLCGCVAFVKMGIRLLSPSPAPQAPADPAQPSPSTLTGEEVLQRHLLQRALLHDGQRLGGGLGAGDGGDDGDLGVGRGGVRGWVVSFRLVVCRASCWLLKNA
jgi:hypothetical protein